MSIEAGTKRATRLRVLAVILLASVALSAVVWFRADEPDPVTLPVVSFAGPNTAEVGDPVEFRVATDGSHPEGGEVVVVALSGLTAHEFRVAIGDRTGAFDLPGPLTETAGLLTLVSGEVRHDLRIAPGDPTDPTAALVGPRTIVADGADFTMAVAAPADRFGNPVADDTPVAFSRVNPLGAIATEQATTRSGLAFTRYTAGTLAGRSEYWATARDIAGPAAIVDEVPDLAREVTVVLPDRIPPADGRTTLTLETEPILDANGNHLLDGTAGEFRITSRAGVVVVPAVVQNQRLRGVWTVPGEPTLISIVAIVNGVESAPVGADVATAITALPVTARSTDDGVRVTVGPAVGAFGAFVADGTTAIVDGRSVALSDGRASLLLPAGTTTVTVTALGRSTTVEVER